MSDLPDNLTPVRAAHVFDQARLADYMKANVEGYRGPISVLQFEGGQSNPTFHVTDGGGRMARSGPRRRRSLSQRARPHPARACPLHAQQCPRDGGGRLG